MQMHLPFGRGVGNTPPEPGVRGGDEQVIAIVFGEIFKSRISVNETQSDLFS